MKEKMPKHIEIINQDGLWWIWEKDGNSRRPLQFAFKDHRDASELADVIAEFCGSGFENAECSKSCECEGKP